ncbi:hypothetical protein ACFCYX_10385 [Streptomyces populi]|uniref:hypothetical protein n=1 Tax=Streptomyces populi TaxID=2058924 RepID=UPI0035E0703A
MEPTTGFLENIWPKCFLAGARFPRRDFRRGSDFVVPGRTAGTVGARDTAVVKEVRKKSTKIWWSKRARAPQERANSTDCAAKPFSSFAAACMTAVARNSPWRTHRVTTGRGVIA